MLGELENHRQGEPPRKPDGNDTEMRGLSHRGGPELGTAHISQWPGDGAQNRLQPPAPLEPRQAGVRQCRKGEPQATAMPEPTQKI